MKEYGFNTTLLHGQRVTILTVRHRYRSTSPVHSVMIQLRNLRKSFQIKWLGILTQESTTRR